MAGQPSNRPRKIRFETPRVQLPIVTLGQRRGLFEDVYHKTMAASWWRFFAVVACVWVAINLFFALLFASHPGCVSGAAAGSLEEAFYFSVQTFSTIGYGAMAPATRFGHLVVALEALVGTLSVALVTGVTFAKFARPTARVLFSAKAVVHLRNGAPHLVFRLANWRGNAVVEGQLRVVILLREKTTEGEEVRVPVELPLVRDRTSLFRLTWIPMHRLDRSSPLWGGVRMLDALRRDAVTIILSFTGLDDTSGQQVHAHHSYGVDDLVFNARFADVVTFGEDRTRTIDYAAIHDVELLGPPEEMAWPDTAG